MPFVWSTRFLLRFSCLSQLLGRDRFLFKSSGQSMSEDGTLAPCP